MEKSKNTEDLKTAKAGRNIVVVPETDDTTCSVCYAEFLDLEDLELHIQQVHPATPTGKLVACQFCDEIFSDAEAYVVHIRNTHLLDFKSCTVCYRIFINYPQLRRHEAKHPPSMREGPFSCSQCTQYFLTKSELRQHELENHFDCGQGVFIDKYLALLSTVVNIKANNLMKSFGNYGDIASKQFTYVCTLCKYKSSDLEAYVLHLKKYNCRTHACERCCSVFKKKSGLAVHNTVHKDCAPVLEELCKPMKQTSKQCKRCKKYFHGNKRNHVCSLSLTCSHCDSVFKSMYELSEHQTTAHPSAVELVTCKFCRKEVVGHVMLEKHMQRSHNHELHLYKYTCTYCDTSFKHPQRLFAHFFLKHKDIEPYLCKICDTKFRVRKGFTLHIKLKHKSEGFVEFDERLHVFFTDKKSEKPFQPVSKYGQKPPEADKIIDKDKRNLTNDKSQDLQFSNMESDVNFTETEDNQTDAKESKEKAVHLTRKRKILPEILELSDYDSDDEPLVVTKKKARLKSQLRKRPLQWKKKNLKRPSKNQFTCKICKKYCYTFQNYQNHVNMHFNDESKKCIKCARSFKTKVDLERHMKDQHSSSQLTETLKSILERRKKGEEKEELSAKKKFLNTIKKVGIEKDNVTATLKPISKELSLQKFIENFTPEGGEGKNVQGTNSVTLTKVTNPVWKEPLIKLTKFKPAPEINKSLIKLAMPVKFKKCNEMHSVTVKKVKIKTMPVQSEVDYTYDDGNQFQDDNDNYEDPKDNNIPEAEQEVTLEGTEEVPKRNPATHKIVIPKLPKELKSIRIAHLLPTAPYYKIVKMADVIKEHNQSQETVKKNEADNIPPAEVTLPDGTKLVHVNPLAHLLGDKPVDQIVQRSKYYKHSSKNFKDLLANAMKRLENPKRRFISKSERAENSKQLKSKNKTDDKKDKDIKDASKVTKGIKSHMDYENLIDAEAEQAKVTEENGNDFETLIDADKTNNSS